MKNAPIIIIRRPRGHGHGHHGGAWKVAYADFVTAMMAFFLVLWILGQSASVKAGVGGYFRDPGVLDYEHSTGILPGATSGVSPDGPPSLKQHTGDGPLAADRKALEAKAALLKEMLASRPEFKQLKDQVDVKMTREGLRIELLEKTNSLFFDTGSAVLKPQTVQLLGAIAAELGTLDNHIMIEGHTDSRRYSTSGQYTNWELSADRANAARRVMESHLPAGRLTQVRGFADSDLRIPSDPLDPRNRRVSIVVSNQAAPGPPAESLPEGTETDGAAPQLPAANGAHR